VRPATGQQIPLPDTSADAIFTAEAFHWFDDDRALAEIARVLRLGARGFRHPMLEAQARRRAEAKVKV
jgi:ubiquinone/menaquinone biosynthesis C-methylase UbiE